MATHVIEVVGKKELPFVPVVPMKVEYENVILKVERFYSGSLRGVSIQLTLGDEEIDNGTD